MVLSGPPRFNPRASGVDLGVTQHQIQKIILYPFQLKLCIGTKGLSLSRIYFQCYWDCVGLKGYLCLGLYDGLAISAPGPKDYLLTFDTVDGLVQTTSVQARASGVDLGVTWHQTKEYPFTKCIERINRIIWRYWLRLKDYPLDLSRIRKTAPY